MLSWVCFQASVRTAFMGMMVAIWQKKRKAKYMNYDDILGTDLDIQA